MPLRTVPSLDLRLAWGTNGRQVPVAATGWRRISSWILWQYDQPVQIVNADDTHILPAGHAFLLPPWVRHRQFFQGETRFRGIRFDCTCFGGRDLADHLSLPWHLPAPAADAMIERAMALLAAGQAMDADPDLSKLARYQQAALGLFRMLLRHGDVRESSDADTRRFQAVIQAMQEALPRALDRHELAVRAGCSPSHFGAWFRQQTGVSPARYQRRLRMRHACKLLEEGEELAAIARQLGYSDPFHFSRAFKNVIGLSPSAYRQHYQS
ncbi:MAG: helix-turn-helix transcriptional regulator [Planctomycetota bacterium]